MHDYLERINLLPLSQNHHAFLVVILLQVV
jgi:hypothetical protein